MSQMKPILFNTEMVKAILDGRKTQTRRILKLPKWIEEIDHNSGRFWVNGGNGYDTGESAPQELETIWHISPYHVGDILYVRETWRMTDPLGSYEYMDKSALVQYKAGGEQRISIFSDSKLGKRWHPSIHMPKEAARIFLRVTDVRVEQLRSMNVNDFWREGTPTIYGAKTAIELVNVHAEKFKTIWDSTVPKKDLDRFGWAANPWVWVIEFERCEKPEVQYG